MTLETPVKIWPQYLRDKRGHIRQVRVTGETSRSWLAGPAWNPGKDKYPKKEYAIATQQEWDRDLWRYKVIDVTKLGATGDGTTDDYVVVQAAINLAQLVASRRISYEVLKQIADLIGYDDVTQRIKEK